MADPERENAVRRPTSPRIDRPQPPDARAAAPERVCAECGCQQLTLVKDAELVAIYQCPACGYLTAPVKGR